MNSFKYLLFFLPFFSIAQEPAASVDKWSNKTTRTPKDTSLVFTDKKFVLYIDKISLAHMTGMVALSVQNKQTVADLKLVQAYFEKRTAVNLNSKQKKKLEKPYEKIKHNDSLRLTYFYIEPLVCELLNFDLFKLEVNGKAQTSYKTHRFGTTEKSHVTYHLNDSTIFWKTSEAIMSRE